MAAKTATKKPKKAAAGTPEDPTDHSKPASEIAVDPKAKTAVSIDAVKIEDAPEENSLEAKIKKSELFVVNDHPSGGGPYVGISPQNDPDASESSKRLSSVASLGTVAPKTGMRVIPKDGDAFTIGEGFGLDATPADWAKVTKPDGTPLFA